MVAEIKAKVSDMDNLYNDLLKRQQDACVVGAPSRLTLQTCC